MQRYVVGFGFTPDRTCVLLVNKLRPAWQKGSLNGVGGKIEPGESPMRAMEREGVEEAGLENIAWSERGRMHGTNNDGSKFECYIFSSEEMGAFEQREDEVLELVPLYQLQGRQVVTNLNFLIPFCLAVDWAYMTLDYSTLQATAPADQ